MNILLVGGLPEEYDGVPISADFRNMIQADILLQEDDGADADRVLTALHQLYPAIPSDIYKAVDGFIWFFSRDKVELAKDEGAEEVPKKKFLFIKVKDKSKEKAAKKAFSFSQDANLIYAAFYAVYNISLTTIDFLHWWEFMALFEGLPHDTLIQKVMYWRTVDVADLSKADRKHVLKMRKIFELKDSGNKKPMTVEELNQQTKDRVARRYQEAQAALDMEK